MSQKQQTAPAQEITRYGVFVVEIYTKDGQEQTRWIRVGVAFPHKDNKGLSIECKAIPVDGKLVIRLHEPQDDNAK